MMQPMIDVGQHNYIFAKNIVMLLCPESRPIRRYIINKKEENKYLDLTSGKSGDCLIVLDNDEVIMSKVDVKTIKSRYSNYIDTVNAKNKGSGLSLEPFIEIGYDNYVAVDSIHAICPKKSATIDRLVKVSKEKNLVIDCTQKATTRSFIILKNGYIIESIKRPQTIYRNYMEYVNKCNNVSSLNIEDNEEDIVVGCM